MGQELMIPSSFKTAVPAKAFAALNPQDDNLAAGIGQSYGVIGYKGKVWSLRHRGERKTFVRPDDGTPSTYIDVVILGQAHQKSKSYYKKFDPNTSDGDRPICSSMDGLTPDLDVAQKQCDSCAICPRNIWKLDASTGRKGRECTDYKRVAVLALPTQTKAILGEPLLEPLFLRVPPDSLNSLAIMGETMAAQGFHYSTYVTRISFEPEVAHPKMVFRPLQPLSDGEAPVIMELRNDPIVGRITGGDIALANPLGVQTLNHSSAAPATAPVAGTAPPSQSSIIDAQPATQHTAATSTSSTTPAQSSAPLSNVDTGFGGATIANQQATPPVSHTGASQPVAQTTADTGEVQESDEDLDAKIAALIKA